MSEDTEKQESQEEQGDFELEVSEETFDLLRDYAEKTGQTEDQVIEYILREFLQDQIPFFAKKSEETGTEMKELINDHFERMLCMIRERDLN